jgi:FAD/FMN-containing dehydrogenase
LAADQALEYEVVTAAGDVVRASPNEHPDLYWALSGGGGGTYGVVTSVVVRAHAIESIGGGSIKFLAATTTKETYTALATRLLELLPGMVDKGATVNYILNPALFSVGPFTVVNSTGDFVRDNVAAELVQAVRDAGVPAAIEFTTLSYRDHFDKYLGPLPYGTLTTSDWQIGGRLIGRRDLEENTDALTSLLTSYVVTDGVTLVGTAGDFTASGNAVAPNAVNPRWRDAIVQQQLMTPWSTDPSAWEAMIEAQHVITNEYVAGLKAETPNGGTYVNEADFREPNWQAEFFGGNYQKLLLAKRTWDPEGLFYGLKLVGSDSWNVDPNGRMCRAGP